MKINVHCRGASPVLYYMHFHDTNPHKYWTFYLALSHASDISGTPGNKQGEETFGFQIGTQQVTQLALDLYKVVGSLHSLEKCFLDSQDQVCTTRALEVERSCICHITLRHSCYKTKLCSNKILSCPCHLLCGERFADVLAQIGTKSAIFVLPSNSFTWCWCWTRTRRRQKELEILLGRKTPYNTYLLTNHRRVVFDGDGQYQMVIQTPISCNDQKSKSHHAPCQNSTLCTSRLWQQPWHHDGSITSLLAARR